MLAVLAAVGIAQAAEKKKIENVNVDTILKNQRLTENYYKCFIGEKNCTPDAQEIKRK